MAKHNKLSLVRETLLPLSSDDLSQVAGGGPQTGCIMPPGTGITRTSAPPPFTGPNPRPSIGGTIGTLTGGTSIRGGQVSGASNAF